MYFSAEEVKRVSQWVSIKEKERKRNVSGLLLQAVFLCLKEDMDEKISGSI